MPINAIPCNFPFPTSSGAIAGAMPKVLLRRRAGQLHLGQTEDERAERYAICADMADQLVGYCHRKASENPAWSEEFTVDRAARGLQAKAYSGQWQFSAAEVNWIIQQIRSTFLSAPPADVA